MTEDNKAAREHVAFLIVAFTVGVKECEENLSYRDKRALEKLFDAMEPMANQFEGDD